MFNRNPLLVHKKIIHCGCWLNHSSQRFSTSASDPKPFKAFFGGPKIWRSQSDRSGRRVDVLISSIPFVECFFFREAEWYHVKTFMIFCWFALTFTIGCLNSISKVLHDRKKKRQHHLAWKLLYFFSGDEFECFRCWMVQNNDTGFYQDKRKSRCCKDKSIHKQSWSSDKRREIHCEQSLL